MVGHRRRRHVPQIELQAARQNRHRHLLRIRRRENEFHVLGRLFQSLQHRIEGMRREHVHFVDHVDLVAPLRGRVDRPIEQRRNFFHRAV